MSLQLLRLKSVQAITGLSRSSIYAMQASGNFPQSINIGLRAVAWVSSDIDAWINAQISASKESIRHSAKGVL